MEKKSSFDLIWSRCKYRDECTYILPFVEKEEEDAKGYVYFPNKDYCRHCSLFLRNQNIRHESKFKKEKSRLRSQRQRLRELAESDEYCRNFSRLKGEILALFKKQKVPAEREIFTCIDFVGFVTLRQTQNILKKENINNYRIRIPPPYTDFGDRWGLKLFFDPLQAYPDNFNPFKWNPTEFTFPYVPGDPDRFKITMKCDVRLPLSDIVKSLKAAVKMYKPACLIEARQERYPDDEIYEVKKLLKKGMNAMQIFKSKYPQFKSFNPNKDYVRDLGEFYGKKYRKKTEVHDAWNAYKRILRLVERIKIRE